MVLGVKNRNYTHLIATGHGGTTIALEKEKKGSVVKDETRQDVKVRDIERNIVQSAIARNPFFTFAALKRYFPNLASIRDLIVSEDYLGGLEITFQGNVYGLDNNRPEKLTAMSGLLSQIEAEIRSNITDYEGTHSFRRDWVHEVFKDKVLKFDDKNPRTADDAQFEHFVSAKDWFAFNTIYGTSEEKDFVRMLTGKCKNYKRNMSKSTCCEMKGILPSTILPMVKPSNQILFCSCARKAANYLSINFSSSQKVDT